MSEITETSTKEQQQQQPHINIPSLFPKLDFKFPHFNLPKAKSTLTQTDQQPQQLFNDNSSVVQKPNVVIFAEKRKRLVVEPLKVECEEATQKSTTPAVLWQVYALGGFLLGRWIWARWNEKRAEKGSSDEDDPINVDD